MIDILTLEKPSLRELVHYGILGMKWGVRKDDSSKNEPSRIVIKKGTSIGHVTEGGNFRLKKGPLYVYHDNHDRNNYVGNFPFSRLNDAHEVLLKTKVDLITPNKKKRVDTFIQTVKGSPDEILTEMGKNKIQSSLFYGIIRLMNKSSFHDAALKENPIGTIGFEKWAAKRNSKNYKKLIESGRQQRIEQAYQDFNAFLLVSDSNRQKYFDTLKREGYNSIMDDNDISVYGSRSPVIVMDAKKSLSVNGTLKITDKMADEALAEHWKNEKLIAKLKKQDASAGWSAM